MKVYKKEEYKIFDFEFSSTTEFLNYLKDTPINTKVWNEENLLSQANNYEFTKTKSLEEAMDLYKFGYHEDFEKLLKLKDSLERYIKLDTKNYKPFNDFVGYAPDVKSYLEGEPMNMYNRIKPRRKSIKIYYNAANLSNVTTDQIFNRGVITLTLTEILEKMGYSVDLNVFTLSSEHDQLHYAKFILKRENERLNIQKLYFPMCHPSFQRRLVFRLREETPGIYSNWKGGYGATCGEEVTKKIIGIDDSNIVICKPDEMGIYGKNIFEDTENVFSHIQGTKKIKTLTLPTVDWDRNTSRNK